jgi:GAF domain-containing protein
MVVTLDFMADDKWAELRHLPTALGFIGAWSMPIKNADGRVLGTFGTYYREKRNTTPAEIAGIEQLANAAAQIVS